MENRRMVFYDKPILKNISVVQKNEVFKFTNEPFLVFERFTKVNATTAKIWCHNLGAKDSQVVVRNAPIEKMLLKVVGKEETIR